MLQKSKENGSCKDGRRKKLDFFTNEMIIQEENPKESTKTPGTETFTPIVNFKMKG